MTRISHPYRLGSSSAAVVIGGREHRKFRPRQLAVVQWTGTIGGSEVLAVATAGAFRKLGVDAEVVFITAPGPLEERLTRAGIPFRSLGFRRGRDVMRQPRRLAMGVARSGEYGAVLPECGFISAALRAGGYRAPIVAVEHGGALLSVRSPARRILRYAGRCVAASVNDFEVGVSDYMLEQMRAGPHARRLRRIYHGVDPASFGPSAGRGPVSSGSLVVGFAGRLVSGKGVEHLIRAIAQVRNCLPVTLLVAGDGPERFRLSRLAHELGADGNIEFLGMLHEVRALWDRCDVAAFPSDHWPESFGMSALEAMACGKPVIATRRCALPEIVVDGATGMLVPPGDAAAIASALIAYGQDPRLLRAHGSAARMRSIECFSLDDSVRAYLDLFGESLSARGS